MKTVTRFLRTFAPVGPPASPDARAATPDDVLAQGLQEDAGLKADLEARAAAVEASERSEPSVAVLGLSVGGVPPPGTPHRTPQHVAVGVPEPPAPGGDVEGEKCPIRPPGGGGRGGPRGTAGTTDSTATTSGSVEKTAKRQAQSASPLQRGAVTDAWTPLSPSSVGTGIESGRKPVPTGPVEVGQLTSLGCAAFAVGRSVIEQRCVVIVADTCCRTRATGGHSRRAKDWRDPFRARSGSGVARTS